jgi:hypothetical protein
MRLPIVDSLYAVVVYSLHDKCPMCSTSKPEWRLETAKHYAGFFHEDFGESCRAGNIRKKLRDLNLDQPEDRLDVT